MIDRPFVCVSAVVEDKISSLKMIVLYKYHIIYEIQQHSTQHGRDAADGSQDEDVTVQLDNKVHPIFSEHNQSHLSFAD